MDRVLQYAEIYPERTRAIQRVKYAIKAGKLKRPPACEVCGKVGKVDGHHEDYTKPLDVMWLCRSCHLQLRDDSWIEKGKRMRAHKKIVN